jgi:rhodanese-related sulfurtransferase
MKYPSVFVVTLVVGLILSPVGITREVKITPELESVTVIHNGKKVVIQRNQDQNNLVNPKYAKTSRPCPPYCIKPMVLIQGVQTIGVLEVLDYLKKKGEGDNSILVIDARAVDSVVEGSIPGSVSIPWDVLSGSKSSPPLVKKLLEKQFGVNIGNEDEEVGVNIGNEDEKGGKKENEGEDEKESEKENEYDFENAKTLILFCNGPWCNKSPSNIRTLLKFGYPSEKLKWYRGGMQSWESFGLTTVTDIPMPWFGL